MSAHLLVWVVGCFMGSLATAWASKTLEQRQPEWPLSVRLLLASFALPMGWVLLQAFAILPLVAHDDAMRARFVGILPRYLDEVLFGVGLKLWACGALCAGFLWLTRARSSASPRSSWVGYKGLWLLCLSCAVASVLPYAMASWIAGGSIGGKGLIVVPVLGFLVGFVPAYAVALGLFLRSGTAQLQWAGRFAGFYAIGIVASAYRWHETVADRPGAWSISVMAALALLGVSMAWARARIASRAGTKDMAAAVLTGSGWGSSLDEPGPG